MTKTITGYFIDPAHGIAEPRTIEKSLDSYYSLLDCSCIDIVNRAIGEQHFDIICDDEALLKAPSYVSAFYTSGEPALVGSLFVCKFDGRDDVTSLTGEELDYVDSHTETGWAVIDNRIHVARVLYGLGL